MSAEDRICLALDVNSADEAEKIAAELKGFVGYYKIGKELFTSAGPEVVRRIIGTGGKVFLDLKYHDIPNTVKGAARAAARLGVSMFNVHCSGGRAMMAAAAEGAKSEGASPLVIGVTLLTSLDQDILSRELGIETPVADMTGRLALLAKSAGLDGVVASPREIRLIKEACGDDFLVVTPGIRPAWTTKDDQKRTDTPGEAVRAGADYLVIGRPIRGAENRREAAEKILKEISDVLG
jgi:orotidine-5'-phosphate decarboxylase